MIRGLDVSQFQGNIDWRKVKASGIGFVWVKATEGADFTDERFNRLRVSAIRKARLRWGPYHYLRPRLDRNGATEARHAIKTARAAGWKPGRRGVFRGRDLPLCVDVERGGNEVPVGAMSATLLREYVSDFCDEAKRLTGRGCVVYLSPGFAAELGGKAPRNGAAVWVAEWDAPDGKPHVPRGWGRQGVFFHQTSDRGTVPGVPGPVDLDVFVGGALRMRALVGGVRLPTPKPPKPAAPKVMSTRETQTALRHIGWPIKVDGKRGPKTAQALRDFQRGYARKTLRVDALVGPATADALAWSSAHGGRCSEHFAFREFASSHSHWIRTHRDLVRGLEKARARLGHPIGVLSGFRDFNLGASNSQHKFGNAMDPTAPLGKPAAIVALGVFSGVGVDGRSGLVRHVDVRHVGPNFTGGTPQHPTVFQDNF